MCVTLIGVKSKYGSGRGTCPGLININNTSVYIIIYIAYTSGTGSFFGSNPNIGIIFHI